jgi:tripartite-type tricarboxylate transporter receptor subunit TctC
MLRVASVRLYGLHRALASVLGWALLAGPASAQNYPSKPVRLIVGYPAGGTTDIVARLIGNRLTERLGQNFLVENRPGAGSNIATEAVINAAPDGYTLLVSSPPNAINASLYPKLSFDFLRDTAAVAGLVRVPNVMEVHPSVPAHTVAEFIAYAKANPGKVNMASSGNGTSIHLSGELFKVMTGVTMVHVPYRGSAPALTDMIGGQVQVMFDNLPSSVEHIRAGKLRALGVTTALPSPALPQVPPVADTVPGYEASSWFGFSAPKATPAEIIGKLNREVNLILAEPRIKDRLAEFGALPMPGTPEDYGKHVADETAKWEKVVKFSGATVD